MALNDDMIEKLMVLSRLDIPHSQRQPLLEELKTIVSFVDQLQEVDTQDILPFQTFSQHSTPSRPDHVFSPHGLEDILKNAPESDHGYFVVPKVVE